MMIYEKAIENYAKYVRERCKESIARYTQAIERMTSTGECPDVACRFCPVRLAIETYQREVKVCCMSSDDERKQYLALEYKDIKE